jgi:hypothetical protein
MIAVRLLENDKAVRFVETNLICKAALLDRSNQAEVNELNEIRTNYANLLMGKLETPTKSDKLKEMTDGFKVMQNKIIDTGSSFSIGPAVKEEIPPTNIIDFYKKLSETQ